MKTKKPPFNLFFLIMVLLIITQAPLFAEPRSGGAYYNYGEALQKAIIFYKAQRSGDLPDDYILPYRADTCLDDGADVGLDLTGGWFDAGDHVKFGMPMSYTASQLGWGVYEFRDAFEQAGLLDTILDEIKWALDYFIKCHPSPNVYYYDCGDGESDHSCWVPPEVVHIFTARNSFKVDPDTPGSDIAGQVAGAMAIGSIIFEPTDSAYAATLLAHAEQLFIFADTYRGKYPLPAFYMSGSFLDDLTWAAVWLYVKTGDESYLDKAKSYIPIGSLGGRHSHCWDDVSYGAVLKLTQIIKDPEYVKVVEANLDTFLPGGGVAYTPAGLAYLSNWGALRYATTAAFLAFIWGYDDSVGTPSKKAAYRTFAEKQINYALGDNPKGSYVVGFGTNPPLHPHHRTSHCSWLSMLDVPPFHRHILYGALVGGPDSNDIPNDDIRDYTLNEVADDYNAGFVGALAKMYSLYGGEPLSNWPQPEDLRPPEENLTEYFVRGWIQWEGPSELHVLFQVNNRSAWPPTVKTGMSARYFMDLSEVFEAGYTANDITLSIKESDEGASVSELILWSENIYYFVLDYTDVSIHPGHWDTCEKETTVSIKSPVTGGFANDWSYQEITPNPDYDCKTFNGKTEYIPVYDNGILLWGEEPPGGTGQTPTPTPTPAITSTPTPYQTPVLTKGDVNSDGNTNIVDALLVAQYYVGIEVTNFNDEVADVNCSGAIDIIDALLIAQYYVGLISEFPC